MKSKQFSKVKILHVHVSKINFWIANQLFCVGISLKIFEMGKNKTTKVNRFIVFFQCLQIWKERELSIMVRKQQTCSVVSRVFVQTQILLHGCLYDHPGQLMEHAVKSVFSNTWKNLLKRYSNLIKQNYYL